MPTPIDAPTANRLRSSAQLVDVLPESIFAQEHLPGAISLPLATLTRERATSALDPAEAVIVYCFDQH
jgi:rhodanese-related sulfurtransferase